MKVVNFFAGPGVGKSVSAASLFVELKKKGCRAELVSEYAKDMVYEGRTNILDDQIYIFAKQNRRLIRLVDHGVDFAVTDSPLPTGLIYNKTTSDSFVKLVMEVFGQYDNHNVVLNRIHPYDTVGRLQSNINEAIVYDNLIRELLNKHNVPYQEFDPDEMLIPKLLIDLGVA